MGQYSDKGPSFAQVMMMIAKQQEYEQRERQVDRALDCEEHHAEKWLNVNSVNYNRRTARRAMLLVVKVSCQNATTDLAAADTDATTG